MEEMKAIEIKEDTSIIINNVINKEEYLRKNWNEHQQIFMKKYPMYKKKRNSNAIY